MKRIALAIPIVAAIGWTLFGSGRPEHPRTSEPTAAPHSAAAPSPTTRPQLELAASDDTAPPREPALEDDSAGTLAIEATLDDLKSDAQSYYDLDDDERARYDALERQLALRTGQRPLAERLDPRNMIDTDDADDGTGDLHE